MKKAAKVIDVHDRVRRVNLLPMLLAFAAGSLVSASAFAQGGKGTKSNSLPPVTIVVDSERFEYRPELGGVYDKDLGVIWGFSFVQLTNSTATYAGAKSVAANYAAIVYDLGDQALDAGLLEEATLYYAAADVADNYTNWRVPTLTEARSAVAGGMFTYGEGGLNIWTGSPTDEIPGLPYDGILTWANDTAKSKGAVAAWVFAPHDGGALLVSQTSAADAIIVRTYTGP